ncbi:M20/M25/M40 family metallo-hydrolase [Selenomonas sp. TAMA-11512]|uniref:M20/M25/M40 family metallo-hydrolase n=1 Tax=Selenomonas sp. TAMA-11512 TaxID=3095337 RepID=UPI003092BA92|nr:M20/M25/M40 family metallo-hydrolase [Selenomonas sp. TAMA-11512]
MIEKKRVLDTFFELVSIRCSTLDEREIGDLLTARLKELGAAEIHEDNAGEILGGNCGNIIANFKGTVKDAPVLMLTAHMDCVEPCANIKPVLKDGVIRSDGTTILGTDDKAGVAAILETLRCLKEGNISHGDLQVVFNVAEEGGVNGSQNIDQNLLHADFGYTLDTHGHPGTAAFKAPGKNQLEVRIQGKTAHAGIAPEAGHNAITAAGHVLTAVPQGRIDEETTCNVGKITGGTATNVVAEFCTICFESRSRDKAKLDAITQRIVDSVNTAIEGTGCTVDIAVKKDYDPYELSPDALPLRYLRKAAEKCGFPVHLEEAGGGSDANFYNSYNIPTAVLAVGMTDCHTKEESILEQDLYDAAELTLALVQEVAAKH